MDEATDKPRAMTTLGLLNFLVLQWFGVRLARSYRMVPDIPPSEFACLLDATLHRVLSNAYGVEHAGPAPTSFPMRRVRDGLRLLRWVWPLTGWWSDYRWIARR